MPLDVSDDWMVFDWLQDITYYERQGETQFGVGVSAQALKREDNKGYELSLEQIELGLHGATWEVWANTFAQSIVPKRGDKFTASGITGVKTWLVETVDYSDRTTRYRLGCLQKGFDG